jgi:hypothetical protein
MANTKRVQFRRGTSAEHEVFTGAEGELTVNTTRKSVHVHDGVTPEGFELARTDFSNTVGGNINGTVGIASNLTIDGYVGVAYSMGLGSWLEVGTDITAGAAVGVGSDLTVGFSAGIGSDLNVGYAATIGTDLVVGYGITLGSDLNVGVNAGIGSDVTIGGSVGIGYTVSIGSTVGIGSDLSVGGFVSVGAGLTVESDANLYGSVGITTDLTVGGNVQINTDLGVAGSSVFDLDVDVLRNLTAKSGILTALSVAGVSTLNDTIINGLNFPIVDGQAGQTIVTDGAGNLTFGAGGASSDSRIRVSALEGDDNNDGRILPVKTIKKACQLASRRLKNLTPGRFLDAADLLWANKEYIKAEVIAYLETTYPSITSNPDYDSTTCARDVGYILDAIMHDLRYGGNSETVRAGLAYWEGAVNAVEGEVTETIAAFEHIIYLSKYIINNIAVDTEYQAIESQVFDNTIAYDATVDRIAYTLDGCANVWSAIGSYVGIVTTIIDQGVGSAPSITYPQVNIDFDTLDAVTIYIEGGEYIEDNPIIVYDGITLAGDSLRNTIVRPLNAGKDLFRIRNAAYVTGLALKDYVSPDGTPQHTFDYTFAFDDVDDQFSDRVGYAGTETSIIGVEYDNVTGIATITTEWPHDLIRGNIVRLAGIAFTCDYDGGVTQVLYPDNNPDGKVDFDVTTILSPVKFVAKTGITTIPHFYAGGGTCRVGKLKVTASPYIQNCSIISFLGGNGILVDGSKVLDDNLPFIPAEAERPPVGDIPAYGKSMVAATFTMVSFGGIGWRTINDGYAQVVSCFQIFCRYGSLTQSGGYLSITNSATNFGLYALRSTGFSPNSFAFDRGRIAETGVSGGLQTLKVVGLGRTEQDLYVLRFIDDLGDDQTQQFKPLAVNVNFTTAGINTATNIFTIAAHPFTQGESVIYVGDEGTLPKQVIDGLVSGNQYYVQYIDASSFQIYEDDSLTRLVSLGSTFVGINTFIKNNQDFLVEEVIDNHNTYQKLNFDITDPNAGIVTFVSGRQISQTVVGGNAVGIALTYNSDLKELIVSVEPVAGTTRLFTSTGSVIFDHTSPTSVSIGVTGVSGISTYYTSTFKVNSTIPGNVVTNIGNLPEAYKAHFHRPSIINSSSHTWEFSGSGTDYNALPQNGGKGKPETEQVYEQGGRVYTSGTNELGDFKIGNFITAYNRTGNIIFNNKVTIGQLDSLRLSLSGGVAVEEFSTDVNLGESELGGPKNNRVSTQLAVRSFLGNRLGSFIDKTVSTSAIPNSVVQLNASGQINPDLIPPKVVNFILTPYIGGKTELVNQIPARNIKQGDTVAEPEDSYVLVNDIVSEYLILDSDTENYDFPNGYEVVSTLSNGGAIGIVTFPTSVSYGTTGLVKGVPITLYELVGGSGYTNPGIYTSIPLDSATGIGTNILATVTIGAGGNVTAVGIETGGRYYANNDILTVNNPALIGGRSGGSNFTIKAGEIETRLYLELTNNQKFPGTVTLPDYVADGTAVGVSTSLNTSHTESFNPTDYQTGGDVDFFNKRIIIGTNSFADGDPVYYQTGGGNVIGGLVDHQVYYIKRVGLTSVELHPSYALSSVIALNSSGSGTHSLTRTGINTDVDTLVFLDHPLQTGDPVRVTGNTPVGINTNSFYYVGSVTENSFTLHTTIADSVASVNGLQFNPVGIADTGSGTITFTVQNVRYSATVNTSSSVASNWSLLAKSDIDAANIISGTISPTRLGSGSATQDTFLSGNSSYQKVIKSVGIGTTQPIQITATSFDLAPGGIGVNTYYGDINISLNRVQPSPDLYSTTGVSKYKTSTFLIGSDGEVQIKGSSTGDVDAATLGTQAPSYYLDPNNLSAAVPITRGGTGLVGLPAAGALLIGNGSAFDQTTSPLFTGQVTVNKNLDVVGVTTSLRFVSDVAQGTAPVSVASSTLAPNLNARYLGGKDQAYFDKKIDTAKTFAYFFGQS